MVYLNIYYLINPKFLIYQMYVIYNSNKNHINNYLNSYQLVYHLIINSLNIFILIRNH